MKCIASNREMYASAFRVSGRMRKLKKRSIDQAKPKLKNKCKHAIEDASVVRFTLDCSYSSHNSIGLPDFLVFGDRRQQALSYCAGAGRVPIYIGTYHTCPAPFATWINQIPPSYRFGYWSEKNSPASSLDPRPDLLQYCISMHQAKKYVRE